MRTGAVTIVSSDHPGAGLAGSTWNVYRVNECMNITQSSHCLESPNTVLPFANEAGFSPPLYWAPLGVSLTPPPQEFTALAGREHFSSQPGQESQHLWLISFPCGIWVLAQGWVLEKCSLSSRSNQIQQTKWGGAAEFCDGGAGSASRGAVHLRDQGWLFRELGRVSELGNWQLLNLCFSPEGTLFWWHLNQESAETGDHLVLPPAV